jgi:hypothetical protein
MCSEEQNALMVPKLAMLYHCTSCERSSILSLAFMKLLLEVSLLQTVLPTVPNFSSTNTLIKNYFGLLQAIASEFPYPNAWVQFFSPTGSLVINSNSHVTVLSEFFVFKWRCHIEPFATDASLNEPPFLSDKAMVTALSSISYR